jgi:hypothetical protein
MIYLATVNNEITGAKKITLTFYSDQTALAD